APPGCARRRAGRRARAGRLAGRPGGRRVTVRADGWTVHVHADAVPDLVLAVGAGPALTDLDTPVGPAAGRGDLGAHERVRRRLPRRRGVRRGRRVRDTR